MLFTLSTDTDLRSCVVVPSFSTYGGGVIKHTRSRSGRSYASISLEVSKVSKSAVTVSSAALTNILTKDILLLFKQNNYKSSKISLKVKRKTENH